MEKKVLIVAPVHQVLLSVLEDMGYTCERREDIKYQEALEIIEYYEGMITSTRLHLDKNFLDRAIQLKWIGRMGSGMEVIDVAYAHSKNIICLSSPEGNANAVAEHALGMLLSLTHRISVAHAEMQDGIWKREENRGTEIEGLTAGIIGYGHNGSAFAQKLKAMGLKVLAYDKYKSSYSEDGIIACSTLEPIWEHAELISFHVPLNAETTHYFDDAFLEAMCKRFILLNLSRGGVVSMAALYDGMQTGKISAAALDVWEIEPVDKMKGSERQQYDKLMKMSNFIGTPHIGGYTIQALYKMSYFLAEKIKKATLSGKTALKEG